MAEIFVDEGLDHIMAVFPKNGANDASLYIGLFSSQTPATVPARTATGGAVPAGWTEVTGQGYARIQILAASWGVQGTQGSGRKTTAAQVTFTATAGAGLPWSTANGFFIATAVASAPGDTIICFANFDSGVARTLQVAGDILKVTPTMEFDG